MGTCAGRGRHPADVPTGVRRVLRAVLGGDDHGAHAVHRHVIIEDAHRVRDQPGVHVVVEGQRRAVLLQILGVAERLAGAAHAVAVDGVEALVAGGGVPGPLAVADALRVVAGADHQRVVDHAGAHRQGGGLDAGGGARGHDVDLREVLDVGPLGQVHHPGNVDPHAGVALHARAPVGVGPDIEPVDVRDLEAGVRDRHPRDLGCLVRLGLLLVALADRVTRTDEHWSLVFRPLDRHEVLVSENSCRQRCRATRSGALCYSSWAGWNCGMW